MKQRRHSNSTFGGTYPSICKSQRCLPHKRSLLDSNQGLRVPIRDVHCAWVYREYDRGKSPPQSIRKARDPTSLSLILSLSLFSHERHLSRMIMCDSLIFKLQTSSQTGPVVHGADANAESVW